MDIDNELRTILSDLSLTELGKFVTGESSLQDVGIDSLEFFEFMHAVEKRFAIELDDPELDSVHTVSDLKALIEYKIQANQGSTSESLIE